MQVPPFNPPPYHARQALEIVDYLKLNAAWSNDKTDRTVALLLALTVTVAEAGDIPWALELVTMQMQSLLKRGYNLDRLEHDANGSVTDDQAYLQELGRTQNIP